jgi:hypothetical protein
VNNSAGSSGQLQEFVGYHLQLHEQDFMEIRVFEGALTAHLQHLLAERMEKVFATANYSAKAQYLKDFHDIEISPEELKTRIQDLYNGTKMEGIKEYLKENFEEILLQAVENCFDEAGLSINDNVLYDNTMRVSASSEEIEDILIKPFSIEVKDRLKKWGKRTSSELSLMNLLDGVLPAYRYCREQVLQLKKTPKDKVKKEQKQLYDLVQQYDDKPSLTACHLMLEYDVYKDRFRLPFSDADSLYNVIKKALKAEKEIIQYLKKCGF